MKQFAVEVEIRLTDILFVEAKTAGEAKNAILDDSDTWRKCLQFTDPVDLQFHQRDVKVVQVREATSG